MSRLRSMTVLPVAAVCIVLFGAPQSTAAQESVFDYWMVDLVSHSWTPIRTDSADGWLHPIGRSDSPDFVVGAERQVLSLGSTATLLRHRSAVRFRQRIGRTNHVLRVGASRDGRAVSENAGNVFLKTGVIHTADVDLHLRLPGTPAGEWALLTATSWNPAFSWMVELENQSPLHDFRLSRWRSHPHPLRLAVPTERVTDVTERNRMDGTTVSAAVSLPLVIGLSVTAGTRWVDGHATEQPIEDDAFLTLSPVGSMRNLDVWLGVERRDRLGMTLQWRGKRADLEGVFLRTDLSAGRLFFGRWDFSQWSVTGWCGGTGGEWRLTMGRDEMASELSVRLETWPVTSVWEQLGVIAYRYRAGLGGSSVWIRLARSSGQWRIAATVARHEADVNQESWVVTSLGLGRAAQESTFWELDSIVFTMLELSRAFPLASGTLTLRGAAGIPVSGRSSQTPLPAETTDVLAGQLNLAVSWAR